MPQSKDSLTKPPAKSNEGEYIKLVGAYELDYCFVYILHYSYQRALR